MKKSRFNEEQIIGMLKQHESRVKTVYICREHGISAATFYQWKQKFSGMDVNQGKQLRSLENANRRLKVLVTSAATR
jgi:putative transposase